MINSTKAHRRLLSRLGALSLLTIALIFGTSAAPASAALPMWGWGSHSVADYVALGDSFTAGQGAPPYLNSSGSCLQSKYASYPVITAALSKHKLEANLSCSGANTADVQAQLGSLTPSELSAARLVTLTVGGIDAGSNAVALACTTNPTPTACQDAIAFALAQLNPITSTLGSDLASTYLAVANAMPNATVVVLNYPRLFNEPTVPGSLENTVNAATGTLNDFISGAIVAANASPARTGKVIRLVSVTDEFANHGIGARIPYINFPPYSPSADANFHPNALGNSFGYFGALLKAGVLW